MTVDGAPVQKTFAAGAGEYIVAGTQRLRTAADLVIGNHDFGTGLVPYIAARRFGTTLVDGVFNLATRNVAADGTRDHAPGHGAHLGQRALGLPDRHLGELDAELPGRADELHAQRRRRHLHRRRHEQRRGHHLPAGALRRDRSSCSAPLTAPDATQQLRVGLQESAGLAWGTLFGPTNTGDWVTMVLDAANVSYAVLGATPTTRPACSGSRTPARSR